MNTIIKGRITGDVVVETLLSGKQVANVRIAENKAYIDARGNKQRVTKFYNVKLWNGIADAFGKTAQKGDLFKFKVNVRANSYLSEKRQEVVNELVMTANRFKLVRLARANRTN